MNFATDEQRFSELEDKDLDVLNKLWVISGNDLKKLGWFPPYEKVKHLLVRLPIDRGIFPYFISHRWESKFSPDPKRSHYSLINLRVMTKNGEQYGGLYDPDTGEHSPDTSQIPEKTESYYWYDYSCCPQNNTGFADRKYLQYIIENLNSIVINSKTLIIRNISDDYFSRGWCFHEWFSAQFLGKFDREFLKWNFDSHSKREVTNLEIVRMKKFADRIISGELGLIDELKFTVRTDRAIVQRQTIAAVKICQVKIVESCIEFIKEISVGFEYVFPQGIAISTSEILKRFDRIVLFIKIWTKILQPVEPISNRVALFFHKKHWDSLVKISQPIAINLLQLEYSVELRLDEVDSTNIKLREIYEFCQRKMPKAKFAVTAFLCFLLMGYDLKN